MFSASPLRCRWLVTSGWSWVDTAVVACQRLVRRSDQYSTPRNFFFFVGKCNNGFDHQRQSSLFVSVRPPQINDQAHVTPVRCTLVTSLNTAHGPAGRLAEPCGRCGRALPPIGRPAFPRSGVYKDVRPRLIQSVVVGPARIWCRVGPLRDRPPDPHCALRPDFRPISSSAAGVPCVGVLLARFFFFFLFWTVHAFFLRAFFFFLRS